MIEAAEALVKECRKKWSKLPPRDGARLVEFADTLLGKQPPRISDKRQMAGKPSVYWFPGLEAKPWHDLADYPWVVELEKSAKFIAEEYAALRAGAGVSRVQETGREDLKPADWQQFMIRRYDDAAWTDEPIGGSDAIMQTNRKGAPRTAELLDRLPISGNASFSVLAPGGRIETHCSDFNPKVICQFGVIIPENCSITVAGETRGWKAGKAIVFDDTYPHSVINDGPGIRVVLMMEAWHHSLTSLELAEIKLMMDKGSRLGGAPQKPGTGRMARDTSKYPSQ